MIAPFDTLIVGGGIVGTAVAMTLAQRHRQTVLVIEAESDLAHHQTGNNSGVIHSGLYYKPGSLKAALCTDGRRRLIDFCDRHGVPYDLCGKLVVATDESELPALAELERRGLANGLTGIHRIGPAEIRDREPHVAGIEGLWVPQTGIIDYRQVVAAYAKQVRALGGSVRIDAKLTRLVRDGDELIAETTAGDFSAKSLINCAGLQSDRVARLCGVAPNVQIVPFRGEYHKLRPDKEFLIRNLVYPVPDPAFPFLGVHFTRMMRGGVEAGPNAVLALDRHGYTRTSFRLSDALNIAGYRGFWRMARKHWRSGLGEMHRSFSKKAFTNALRKLLPELEMADLVPGGAGIRAQALDPSGKLVDDFRIIEADRMIHVLNAPSPAATASLAIAHHIAQIKVPVPFK